MQHTYVFPAARSVKVLDGYVQRAYLPANGDAPDCIQNAVLPLRKAREEVRLYMLDPGLRSDTTLDADTVQAILRLVRPRPEELGWQAIPWRTSLPEAVEIAAREHKPVFLWAMNGNPLALT